MELPASCSNKYRPGLPSDDAQILSQFVVDVAKKYVDVDFTFLNNFHNIISQINWTMIKNVLYLIFSSGILNLEDLCIAPKKVYLLYFHKISIY